VIYLAEVMLVLDLVIIVVTSTHKEEDSNIIVHIDNLKKL